MLLNAVVISVPSWAPLPGSAEVTDPLFNRLRNRYILFRPGESTFEAADIVDSNPINKQSWERGLTRRGREQVRRSAEALRTRGITSPTIFYDNGARGTQTADIIADTLTVPRAAVEPEFRWLEARGLGELEGTSLSEASTSLRVLDATDVDNRAGPTDDGTPSDSVNDVFSRMRNTVAKIENSYSGGDFIIVPGDAAVLSVFAAAACGVNLAEHTQFTLRPGEFFDLRELTREYKAGTFTPMALDVPTDADIARGREYLRQMGPRVFSDTDAGSWVLGEDVRR